MSSQQALQFRDASGVLESREQIQMVVGADERFALLVAGIYVPLLVNNCVNEKPGFTIGESIVFCELAQREVGTRFFVA